MSLNGTQSIEQMALNTDKSTLILISQGSLSAVLLGREASSPRDDFGGSTRAAGNRDRDGDLENDVETETDG